MLPEKRRTVKLTPLLLVFLLLAPIAIQAAPSAALDAKPEHFLEVIYDRTSNGLEKSVQVVVRPNATAIDDVLRQVQQVSPRSYHIVQYICPQDSPTGRSLLRTHIRTLNRVSYVYALTSLDNASMLDIEKMEAVCEARASKDAPPPPPPPSQRKWDGGNAFTNYGYGSNNNNIKLGGS